MRSTEKADAKHLLVHYFKMIARDTNVNLDGDCFSEIEDIIEFTVQAAVDEAVAKALRSIPQSVIE